MTSHSLDVFLDMYGDEFADFLIGIVSLKTLPKWFYKNVAMYQREENKLSEEIQGS
jgi:hypothetical protein